jgi:hypothetical protein
MENTQQHMHSYVHMALYCVPELGVPDVLKHVASLGFRPWAICYGFCFGIENEENETTN